MNLAAAAIAGLFAASLAVLGTWLSPRWLEESPAPRRREYVVQAVLGLLLGGLIGLSHGMHGVTWQYALLTGSLLTAASVDLKEKIIPNEVVLATLGGAILLQLIFPAGTWSQAAIGAVAGFGILFIMGLVYRGAMGAGDIKYMAAIGFVLNWQSRIAVLFFPTAMSLMFAFILGGIISVGLLVTRKVTRKDFIPFGPFLALGALITMLWGAPLVNWYLGMH